MLEPATIIPAEQVPEEVQLAWRRLAWNADATLGELAAHTERARPSAWLVCASATGDVRITHADFMAEARRVAGGLHGLGVRRGDVIAIQLPASREAVLAHAACALLGATALPIVHIYGTHELAFVLREARAHTLVTIARNKDADTRAVIGALPDLPDLRHHVVIGARDGGPNWNDLLAAEPLPGTSLAKPDEIALLVYTSGTTANPKGVQHSHRSLGAELSLGIGEFVRESDAMLCPWPPGHIAGYLMLARFWALGFDTVLMEQWDGGLAARLVDEYKVVLTQGTPFHLTAMLDAAERDGRDLSSIAEYVAGATIVSPQLMARGMKFGIVTLRSFGLSECPTASRGTRHDPVEKRINTDGRACPGVEIRIIGDDDRDVTPGEQGEVVLRAPEQFAGYRQAALNRDAFLPGGWLRTGDIGLIDAEDYLSITDRKKDIIIRGGENISSREVEELVAMLPAVREVAAVGLRDERMGERVCVMVALHERTSLTLEDIATHFGKQGVAKQKIPERLVIVEDFPRTPSGKIKKHELRATVR